MGQEMEMGRGHACRGCVGVRQTPCPSVGTQPPSPSTPSLPPGLVVLGPMGEGPPEGPPQPSSPLLPSRALD